MLSWYSDLRREAEAIGFYFGRYAARAALIPWEIRAASSSVILPPSGPKHGINTSATRSGSQAHAT